MLNQELVVSCFVDCFVKPGIKFIVSIQIIICRHFCNALMHRNYLKPLERGHPVCGKPGAYCLDFGGDLEHFGQFTSGQRQNHYSPTRAYLNQPRRPVGAILRALASGTP